MLLLAAAGTPDFASGAKPDLPDVRPMTLTGPAGEEWSPQPPHEIVPPEQARMDRRIILRISPRPMPLDSEVFDDFDGEPLRLVERPGRRCVQIRDITGTADQGRRLVLFLRNDRILVADLARGCSARDFYRGFYLERSEDGRMCAGRDVLLARSGAKCELAGLRELVPAR